METLLSNVVVCENIIKHLLRIFFADISIIVGKRQLNPEEQPLSSSQEKAVKCVQPPHQTTAV